MVYNSPPVWKENGIQASLNASVSKLNTDFSATEETNLRYC